MRVYREGKKKKGQKKKGEKKKRRKEKKEKRKKFGNLYLLILSNYWIIIMLKNLEKCVSLLGYRKEKERERKN